MRITIPHHVRTVIAAATFLAPGYDRASGIETIVESAREIPVAYDVDVVVVGGTTGAITAAVEAASKGAKVFLAAPRPYLGEDIAGTLRLWLEEGEEPETPLEREIFDRAASSSGFANQLEFTYEADQKADAKHPDPAGKVLTNSKWATASNDSVQFNADVTLVADLGKMARVKELHLLAFQRAGEFEVGDVEVWTFAERHPLARTRQNRRKIHQRGNR